MKFDRIHIIGGPGSGKSYAAKRLSKILKIPCFDLDDIFWHEKDKDYTLKAAEKERDKKLLDIIKKNKWIAEGAFSSWTKKSFQKADIIMILRPGKYLRALRIIKRSLKSNFKLNDRKKETLKGFFEFLRWNHIWDKKDILKIERRLKEFKKKIVYFKSADEAIDHICKHLNT